MAKTRKIFGILRSGFICRTEEVEVDVYTKFHRARSIRTLKKIGGTESLNTAMMAMAMMAMMGIGVLDAKRHISISHKNQSIWNIDTRFTASCSLRQDLSIAIGSKVVACGGGPQKRCRNRRFRRAGAVGYIHVREAVTPFLRSGGKNGGATTAIAVVGYPCKKPSAKKASPLLFILQQ